MADKNLNDFFDDEFNKQEEQRSRQQQQTNGGNNNAYGFGYDEQRHNSMYQGIPEYQQGQDKFVARKSKKKTALLVSLVAVLMVIVFFLGYCTFLIAHPDLKFINDVLGLVNKNAYLWYEDENDPYQHDYAYQAAKAILESIDQYSTLLTPEEYYELMTSVEEAGSTNGVSYTLSSNNEYVVYEVDIGSPAYNKGLFPGDIVTKLKISGNLDGVADGEYEISPATKREDFIKYIHSTLIDFTVLRNGTTVEVNGVNISAYYKTSSVEYYFGENNTNMSKPYMDRIGADKLPSDTAYIRLTTFMDTTAVYDDVDNETGDGDFGKAMNAFKASGKKKLIFDLCGNGGGRSDVAEKIASYLCYDKNNENIVVSVNKDKDNNVIGKDSAKSVYGNYFDVSKNNIVVLTDGGSASASEMLLGAMLDYNTCVQVGTNTYGKGIAQGVIPLRSVNIQLANGEWVNSYWAAYMTYVKFYTPLSDVCHHGIGFAPSAANTATNYDGMMQRALQILRG